jgi:hypothetical protein
MERRYVLKLGAAGIGAMAIGGPARALGAMASSAKKEYAVIYATWCGSTKDAAGWINEGMGGIADVIDVKDKPKVDDYKGIVLGSAIRQMVISPDMKTYLQTNKTALKDKVKGLFAVCGNNSSTTITDATKKKYTTDANGVGGLCGVTTALSMVFPGRVNQCAADAGITIAQYDHLKQADCAAFGQEIKKILPTTSANMLETALPRRFDLCQNFPNPFDPITTVTYSIPATSNVTLTVCGMNGRLLTTLVSGVQAAGTYKVNWDGSRLSPGYYLYRLEAGSFSATRTARRVGK